MTDVHYVVYGAGSIGGLVGARLHQAGRHVTLIARGPHRAAIERAGLQVRSPAGTDVVPLPVVGQPSEIAWGAGHIAMLGMKSQHTGEALAALAAVAGPDTPVVSLQNGVANEPAALRFFHTVLGVVVMCPAGHLEPGVVLAWSAPVTGILDVGRFPSGVDALTHAVAADFAAATFDARAVPDIMRWKYRKLLSNTGNAIEAICGEWSADLANRVLGEAEGVLAVAGIPVASEAEDEARRAGVLQSGPISGQRRPGGSTWQSLHRGTGSVETDYLNGEIVLLGRLHSVPTQANALLQRLAREMATGGRPPGSLAAGEVLRMLPKAR